MDSNRVNSCDDEYLELSEENVLLLWSRTYNTNGKPDWSHIYKYYHDDIVFHDTIQRIEGKEEFMALCDRLTGRCKQLNMDIESIFKKNNEIIFDWKMTMMFKKFPSTPIFGCTKLTLHEDGRIIRQQQWLALSCLAAWCNLALSQKSPNIR